MALAFGMVVEKIRSSYGLMKSEIVANYGIVREGARLSRFFYGDRAARISGLPPAGHGTLPAEAEEEALDYFMGQDGGRRYEDILQLVVDRTQHGPNVIADALGARANELAPNYDSAGDLWTQLGLGFLEDDRFGQDLDNALIGDFPYKIIRSRDFWRGVSRAKVMFEEQAALCAGDDALEHTLFNAQAAIIEMLVLIGFCGAENYFDRLFPGRASTDISGLDAGDGVKGGIAGGLMLTPIRFGSQDSVLDYAPDGESVHFSDGQIVIGREESYLIKDEKLRGAIFIQAGNGENTSGVSRVHCVIFYRADSRQWRILDCGTEGHGSMCGTLLVHPLEDGTWKSQLLCGEEVSLRFGDIVCIAPDGRGSDRRWRIGEEAEHMNFRFSRGF